MVQIWKPGSIRRIRRDRKRYASQGYEIAEPKGREVGKDERQWLFIGVKDITSRGLWLVVLVLVSISFDHG